MTSLSISLPHTDTYTSVEAYSEPFLLTYPTPQLAWLPSFPVAWPSCSFLGKPLLFPPPP